MEDRSIVKTPPDVGLRELLLALKEVMGRAELFSHHHIQMEPLSVRERMSMIMQALGDESYVEFQQLFSAEEGRRGVVVSFLALMELTREKLVDLVQNEPLGQIYVRTAGDGLFGCRALPHIHCDGAWLLGRGYSSTAIGRAWRRHGAVAAIYIRAWDSSYAVTVAGKDYRMC